MKAWGPALVLCLATAPFLLASPARAEQLCVADLDGDGAATASGEQASCASTTAGIWLCPLEEVSCVAKVGGLYTCPAGTEYVCVSRSGQAVPSCSPHSCADTATTPITTTPAISDAGVAADGTVDAAGNCLGTISIFAGRGMRCRPAGLATTFSDCCRDRGTIIKDGMGSSASSLGTKIAVAKAVFNGMQAAYAALQAGANAAQAASAGANALVVGVDPTSIAISLAINFMLEYLLSGCDSQDMETAMLKASGMCHEVGSYCTASFLGVCLQKARGHCCFNTKLGRILQEQGRPQLKAFNDDGWGMPQAPMCRGFTAEEFQALDFSKMDLSEYYTEIESRAQSTIEVEMEEKADAYLEATQR